MRLARKRLASERSAPPRFASLRVAPGSAALIRLARKRLASERSAPPRFASLRNAPLRFGCLSRCVALHVFQAREPFLRSLRWCRSATGYLLACPSLSLYDYGRELTRTCWCSEIKLSIVSCAYLRTCHIVIAIPPQISYTSHVLNTLYKCILSLQEAGFLQQKMLARLFQPWRA